MAKSFSQRRALSEWLNATDAHERAGYPTEGPVWERVLTARQEYIAACGRKSS